MFEPHLDFAHCNSTHIFKSTVLNFFFEFNNYAERYFQKNNHNKDEVVTVVFTLNRRTLYIIVTQSLFLYILLFLTL